MAVVRVGFLRMISLSQTATERTANVEHIITDVQTRPRELKDKHLPKGQLGVNVKAQCGTHFTGAIHGNAYSLRGSEHPVYFTNQRVRLCTKCHGAGTGMFITICRPWRVDDLPALGPGELF